MARTSTKAEPSVADLVEQEVEQEPEHDEAPAAAPAEAPEGESVQQAKNRLRNEAERIILDRYKAEFYKEAERLYAENGYEFKRRLTEQEKAQQKIEELLAQNPELREQYAPTTVVADHNPGD